MLHATPTTHLKIVEMLEMNFERNNEWISKDTLSTLNYQRAQHVYGNYEF